MFVKYRSRNQLKIWWCPACKKKHKVDKRWKLSGSVMKPTIEPEFVFKAVGDDSEEIAVDLCKGKIIAGKIHYNEESSHELAGKIIDMINLNNLEDKVIESKKLDDSSMFGKFGLGRGAADKLAPISMRDLRR